MASILLPTVFGVIFYRHLPSPLRVLSFFLLCSVITEGIGYYCFLSKLNNMPLFHIDTFIQFTFLTIIYYQLFQTIQSKLILVFMLVIFTAFMIIEAVFITSIFEPNSISRTTEALMVILICLFFIFPVRRSSWMEKRAKKTYSLLSFSLLIFFIGTLLVSVYSKGLMKEELYKFWVIHSVLNISLNIAYTVVIWNSVGLRKPLNNT